MKRRLILLLTILLTSLSLHQTVDSQRRRGGAPRRAATINEEKSSNVAVEAPIECTRLVREFIAYSSRPKPDIASDKQAQSRWLSDELRKGLEHRLSVYHEYAKKNEDSPEEPPGNADFVGSWDYPTTYSIVGSRRYNKRAIVDVHQQVV